MELSTYQIIAGAVVAILSAFGVGKVFELLLRRRFKRTDELNQLHDTNRGKAIDANVLTTKIVIERLTNVEVRVDKLQEKLSEEMAKNSRLEAENEAFRKENERQAKRLHGFAEKLVHKDAEILALRNELHATRIELEKLKAEFRTSQALLGTPQDRSHQSLVAPGEVVNVHIVDEEAE